MWTEFPVHFKAFRAIWGDGTHKLLRLPQQQTLKQIFGNPSFLSGTSFPFPKKIYIRKFIVYLHSCNDIFNFNTFEAYLYDKWLNKNQLYVEPNETSAASRPCAWFWKNACIDGKECIYCHLCPDRKDLGGLQPERWSDIRIPLRKRLDEKSLTFTFPDFRRNRKIRSTTSSTLQAKHLMKSKKCH